MQQAKPSIVRTIFGMMMNPAKAMKGAFANNWILSAGVSALAFGLFFMQTGLDLYKTGQKEMNFVFLSAGLGILYGLILIPLLGIIIWIILKAAKTDRKMLAAVSAFCLSYSGALIYGILGLAFSLALGWKTSISFGVTGVLWAIGPMMITIRELTGAKNVLSIPLSTMVSAVILVSWSLFGNM